MNISNICFLSLIACALSCAAPDVYDDNDISSQDSIDNIPTQDTIPIQTVESIDLSKWELQWSDEFDYIDAQLDKNWNSQNGPSGHILCSRWRENAVVDNGVLQLVNKKEESGGQSWTSGNIWTKKKFKYGYFECRYKYAASGATNNSFWLMTKGADPKEGKRFEIDINEGHFPNEVNTNIHNWGDVIAKPNGSKHTPRFPKVFLMV
jgi:beta-glucanase (GH16 family)